MVPTTGISDFVISLIRTYVPIGVGALISWFATLGISLDGEAAAGLVIFLTAVLQGMYYLVVRLLERRWPAFGALLGKRSEPIY